MAYNEKELLDLWQDSFDHLWYHFTQINDLRGGKPKLIVSGKGSTVVNHEGRRLIDGLAGLFSVQIGHGRPEMAEVIRQQIETLEYFSLFGFSNVPASELAKLLARIAPGELSTTCFSTSGSEAVEVALKVIRHYQRKKQNVGRYKIVARRMSFHGVTMGALSANGLTHIRTPYEPLVPGFRHIPAPNCYRCEFGKTYPNCDIDCARALESLVKFEGPESVAGFIAEPVAAAGGVVVPPREYFPTIREICSQYGMLLCVDEVLTGFGRTGRWFASEYWGISPDVMTFAKGITSGYVPLGATMVTREVAKMFEGKTYDAFHHGQTFAGHPVSCRAALKNIEIMQAEHVVENAREVGEYLKHALEDRLLGHRMVGQVTGLGLLLSIELVQDRKTKVRIPEEIGIAIRERLYELGLICRFQISALVLAPCLILTKGEADRIVELIDQAITEAERKYPV